MYIYKRKINYYETDKMGIVHHSNYIRFFEEARCSFTDSNLKPLNLKKHHYDVYEKFVSLIEN